VVSSINSSWPSPGGTAPFPDLSGQMSGLFFYNKLPQWTWDIKKQESDKSILDNLRYVVVEGMTGYIQGYAAVFMLVNFLWIVTIAVQCRAILAMGFMISAVQTTKKSEMSVVLTTGPEQTWELNSMRWFTKFVGISLLIVRLVVVLFVGWEGFRFLNYTCEKVDLLLNSLALEFVLNINVAFAALVSKTNQKFIEKLDPIKYVSLVPRSWFRPLRVLAGPIIVTICIGGAVSARAWQLHIFESLFNDAAALCLFGGPHPHSDTFMAPVPGLCESLLHTVCATSNQSKTGPLGGFAGPPHESCVITDFGITWPKSVRAKSTLSLWPNAVFNSETNPDIWSWSYNTDPKIQSKFANVQDYLTADLAKVCMALYDGKQQPYTVIADGDTGEEAMAAPFQCRKDSGIRAYFENYVWAVTRSELWKRDDEAGGSWFPLMSKDPGLSSVLAKCH